MTEPTTDPRETGDQVADFDAFFAEQGPAKREGERLRLYGREYRLPATVPALFTLQLQRVQNSARPEDIRAMLAALFGPDAVDDWAAHGMGDDQLGTVLLWGTANCAKPGSMSVERAAELYREREQAKSQQGKANRPANRSKGKGKPRSSGTRS